ncbi:LysE/ArgO family amino acid transporter [Geobacter sp. AOG2]|uniref:LysE/ArgO family amino acid transporter n=1 Tax=Geobacter sp. AOG2 TaxID=1566347 RepID=UPI001CC45D52|nr:LysE/ArgO family amino acid transporter [Geobacter sp. AOG2]GFE60444.1 amino acid transporter [Geobacter sp. AOG2]
MNHSSFSEPLVHGFSLGASLIIAIGSQNAFVLRQGLRREYVFTVSTICFLCDMVLIGLGAGGFGTFVASSPRLLVVALWGGAVFLFCYGIRSFWSAVRPQALATDLENTGGEGLAAVVATTLALSLLNPHVYLDTVLLLGSLAAQFSGQARVLFALGAMAASLVWFYGIGYGARIFASLFRTPIAWRVLDILVGCTMWGIGTSLIWKRVFTG